MLVGDMRVSSDTDLQTTDLQRDALLDAGVEPRQLCADKARRARDDRPGLQPHSSPRWPRHPSIDKGNGPFMTS